MESRNDNSISLNKYISSSGICSRREADRLIESGKVSINGKRAQKGNRVLPGDHVKVNGKKLRSKSKPIYIAFNKPMGIVCTTDLKEPKNIITYIGHTQRLFPIGRLDKMSTGLIFLTNDGDIVNKILRSENEHEKEYFVKVDRDITDAFVQGMLEGVPILGKKTKPCKIDVQSPRTFKITLTEGMNRQIRRMCEHFEYEVKSLRRTRIMHISLNNLKIGKWRNLSSKEMYIMQKKIK